MSKYTTEVRFICENAAGYDESKGYSSVDEIIEAAVPKIFTFPLHVFDEAYKQVLFSKILKHYYTREIGLETVGLWRLKLETKLQEIMPFYNQLYESELLKFNPLYDTDLHTTHVGEENREGTRNENRNGERLTEGQRLENQNFDRTEDGVTGQENRSATDTDTKGESLGHTGAAGSESGSKTHYDLFSDTPQGGLTGVNAENYLTDARKITDSDSRSSSSDTDTTALNQEKGRSETEENRNETRLNKEKGNTVTTGTDTGKATSTDTMTGAEKMNSTESYVLHVMGKQSGASFSKMLLEFRDTFLNIDMMIINDLNELFMQLW